ncbi:RecX family transcriptional regulator [Candidatus Woesebacteria bacterium]|nr:RecX family transcriptional regulator [Candidatus Woesebacteria bacterium]
MPIVTSIKQQKNKNRVNIYLDGKFGIGLDLDNFVKLNLKVEENLTEREIEKIKNTADFAKIYNNLLRFATLRPRSEKEINNWLYRKKVPENFKRKLFNKLNRLELVGDEKFAKWWIDQRQTFRPKSLRIMKHELRMKGIDKEIIEKVLAGAGIDEVKNARVLLEKKSYRWKELASQDKRKKMTEFLARKGFGWEVVKEVVNDRR